MDAKPYFRSGGSDCPESLLGRYGHGKLVDNPRPRTYTDSMEVHFSPNTEAQLKQLAARKGKDAAQVVQEAVSNMLQRQARFIEGVERGIASADRGDLIDHDEVVDRVERLLQS